MIPPGIAPETRGLKPSVVTTRLQDQMIQFCLTMSQIQSLCAGVTDAQGQICTDNLRGLNPAQLLVVLLGLNGAALLLSYGGRIGSTLRRELHPHLPFYAPGGICTRNLLVLDQTQLLIVLPELVMRPRAYVPSSERAASHGAALPVSSVATEAASDKCPGWELHPSLRVLNPASVLLDHPGG